jgi:hypothetical protein
LAFFKNANQSRRTPVAIRADVNEEGNLVEVEDSTGTNLVTIDGDGDVATSGDVTASGDVAANVVRESGDRLFVTGTMSPSIRSMSLVTPFAAVNVGVDQTCLLTYGKNPDVMMRARLTIQNAMLPHYRGGKMEYIRFGNTAEFVEYLCTTDGIDRTDLSHPLIAVAGTDARTNRLKVSVTNSPNQPRISVGFRRLEQGSWPSTIAGVEDIVVMENYEGTVQSRWGIDGAVHTTEDFSKTWADDAVHEMKTVLNASGVVSFYWNGVEVGTPRQMTVTDELVPIIVMGQNGTSPSGDACILHEWEVY